LCGEAAEIRGSEPKFANHAANQFQFLMRQSQESIEKAELVKEFERRRVHGIAAKIPKEIAVFLEYRNPHALPGQEVAQHHAGGTAADHATGR
jgi:hypothetical protein